MPPFSVIMVLVSTARELSCIYLLMDDHHNKTALLRDYQATTKPGEIKKAFESRQPVKFATWACKSDFFNFS